MRNDINIMPELPEVEITLRGIKPHILNQTIFHIVVRYPSLRFPIEPNINQLVKEQTVQQVMRIGKYLLLNTAAGTMILHLGMSGSLRIFTTPTPPKKHDHVDIVFANHVTLRLHDPRRFGAFLWTTEDPTKHPLLMHLGPEPLSKQFSTEYLWALAEKRKVSIKSFIMNSKVVVGVGNIYANEALFDAGIHPEQAAHSISKQKITLLVQSIKKILRKAIKQGGTTLKDFVDSTGKKGYFRVHLKVYGRGKQPCLICKTTIKEIRLGQRSTFYCPSCQKHSKG
jgi:formamidopyrimidine-DNA glycosylase